MNFYILSSYLVVLLNISAVWGIANVIPILNLDPLVRFERNFSQEGTRKTRGSMIIKPYDLLPFIMLVDNKRDTSEYWRETEILSLVRNREEDIDYAACALSPEDPTVQLPTRRTVRAICRNKIDHQLCPQCPHFNNHTECELFRHSCTERRVNPSEYHNYCENKYGKYRTMFLPAVYSQCRCCDECIFYRELDQSCVNDEYSFESDEFLPVTTIGVPVTVPALPNDAITILSALLSSRKSSRVQPPVDADCPISCAGYECSGGLVSEHQCAPGGFIPDRDRCNCCGRCSSYQQLKQKCANYKKTDHYVNGSKEVEVEEEFLEPGCDDGLVCRHGVCQDIHVIEPTVGRSRTRRDNADENPNEPCKQELKYFKKKYGEDGHLHYNAPQCTPLWLYAPVQCRRFVCYCALEDGTFIEGIKVPRIEVSNMNCDCAREKCRSGKDVECDGYGNYKEAVFRAHVDNFSTPTTSVNDEEPPPTTPVLSTMKSETPHFDD